MARNVRFYQKKRGNRRTGSRRMGSLGEALFFGVFLAIGCVVLVVMIYTLIIPEWRVNNDFKENKCKVLRKWIEESTDEDGTTYRPMFEIQYRVGPASYNCETYDIHGFYSSGRSGKEEVLNRFTVYTEENGQFYPCWYDPANPKTAVLVRGFSWMPWVFLLLPIVFILVGGIGLVYRILHWGKSAEHKAASSFGAGRDQFPSIPDDSDITNSPGTTLNYRLPIATSPGWALFGALMACLFWNGIVSVFVTIAVNSHLKGDPEWFLTIFIIPFVLIGLGLIVFFFRQLLITTGVGPTTVEISQHPVHPGDACRILVSQSGRLSMNSLVVSLVCEEEATYRQGTNTRTETVEVFSSEIYRREGFEIQSGLPFEAECELAIPIDAMHSFKSDHNGVKWKVAVKGDIARWPDINRSFPIVIRPAADETSSTGGGRRS